MIIEGRFIADAPYFPVDLASPHFAGRVWMLADTGASQTALLDFDVQWLAIPNEALVETPSRVVGIGGSVRSWLLRDVVMTLGSDEGDVAQKRDLRVVRHDLECLSPAESQRILRLPSLLGRDLMSGFRLVCDYRNRVVQLEA